MKNKDNQQVKPGYDIIKSKFHFMSYYLCLYESWLLSFITYFMSSAYKFNLICYLLVKLAPLNWPLLDFKFILQVINHQLFLGF